MPDGIGTRLRADIQKVSCRGGFEDRLTERGVFSHSRLPCQRRDPNAKRLWMAKGKFHQSAPPAIDLASVVEAKHPWRMAQALLDALSAVTGTGDFHSTGTAPFFFPALEVDGVGEIAFPIPASQAKELVAAAESAPYGKGEHTVHDETVRKCFQIDASRFSLNAPQWKKFLIGTLSKIRDDMGIKGEISAQPYKLLVYPQGGHFKAHRDTEKLDAMFGTLIIALPSSHEGGLLFVRHDGREIEINFSDPGHRHDFQYAAFFADCEHEVAPVRSGYRVCLVYNLRLDEGTPAALNLSLDHQARSLLPAMHDLRKECGDGLRAVLLGHGYTAANFSLRNLKGDDTSRARAMLAAARECGLSAHLALVELHQSGELIESERSSRRSRRYYDDDDFDSDPDDGEIGEIYEESLTIDHWRDAKDRPVPLGCYGIDSGEIIAKEPIDEGDPDQKEGEGYTGNAGCTMDYWYRRAAVVFWAEDKEEAILCQHDFSGACARFASLAQGKSTGRDTRFDRLGEAIVARLPDHCSSHHYRRSDAEAPFLTVLGALARTGRRDLLDRLISTVPENAWDMCDAAVWTMLNKSFGVETFAGLIGGFADSDPAGYRNILFRRLEALLSGKETQEAARIASVLVRLPAPRHGENLHWHANDRHEIQRREIRVILAAGYLLSTKADLKAALDFVLGDRSLDHIRKLLGPVLLLEPVARLVAGSGTLAAEARAFAIRALTEEAARKLAPYPDLRRPCPPLDETAGSSRWPSSPYRDATVGSAFRELQIFMADPDEKEHHFRYRQDVRNSLESFIVSRQLDLDHVTVRKGTPHRLVCTKNDASHLRALQLREDDEKLLARLGAY